MKPFHFLFFFSLFIILSCSNVIAETPEQSIAAIKSAAIVGNAGKLLSYFSLSSIAENEISRYLVKIEQKPVVGKAIAKAIRKTAGVSIANFIGAQIHILLKYTKGARIAAVKSFKVSNISVKGKTATISASYAVPGAAEGVGLAMNQSDNGRWIITGINSKLLRNAISKVL